MVFANWRGVFAQKSVDAAHRDKLIEGYASLRSSEAWRQVLRKRGWQSLDLEGDGFSAFLAQQERDLVPVLKALGFVR